MEDSWQRMTERLSECGSSDDLDLEITTNNNINIHNNNNPKYNGCSDEHSKQQHQHHSVHHHTGHHHGHHHGSSGATGSSIISAPGDGAKSPPFVNGRLQHESDATAYDSNMPHRHRPTVSSPNGKFGSFMVGVSVNQLMFSMNSRTIGPRSQTPPVLGSAGVSRANSKTSSPLTATPPSHQQQHPLTHHQHHQHHTHQQHHQNDDSVHHQNQHHHQHQPVQLPLSLKHNTQMQQLLQQHVFTPNQLQQLMKHHSFYAQHSQSSDGTAPALHTSSHLPGSSKNQAHLQRQHNNPLELTKKQLEQNMQHLQEQLQMNLLQQSHLLQQHKQAQMAQHQELLINGESPGNVSNQYHCVSLFSINIQSISSAK